MRTGRRKCLILAAVVTLILTGCSYSGQKKENPVESENALQIGLSFDSFVIERWTRDRDMFVSTAQSLGAQVNVQVANGDVQEQV